MEWLWISVGVFVLWALFRNGSRAGSSGSSRQSSSPELRIFNKNIDWLRERWERINEEIKSGKPKTVEDWFFDDVTEPQLNLIDSMELEISGGRLTKGQASDIIGLYEYVEPKDAEKLRFFKVSQRGMNETRARDAVAQLFADPQRAEEWRLRPAIPLQKEFYRFFELKVPKGLMHKDAKDFINERGLELMRREETKFQEWQHYESILEWVSDPDFREDHEIKNVSIAALRGAIAALVKEGRSMSELDEDLDLVVAKLLERNANLQRR